jgi:hypothetical protein
MPLREKRTLTSTLLPQLAALSLLCACSTGPDDAGATDRGDEFGQAGHGEAEGADGLVEKAGFEFTPFGAFCQGSQPGAVRAAEAEAIRYLDAIANSETAIRTGSATTKDVFRAHFASTSTSSLDFVFGTYRGIRDNIVDTIYTCRANAHPDCDGSTTGGELARAITNGSTNFVRLCPLFFESPLRTQAQTLIHELSHQNRTSPDGVGTDDLVGASTRNAHQYGIYAPRCAEDTCVIR